MCLMKIVISQQNIDDANKARQALTDLNWHGGSINRICPISQAVNCMFPNMKAHTGQSTLYIDSENDVKRVFKLPLEAQMFISNFDDKCPVHPMSFEAIEVDIEDFTD